MTLLELKKLFRAYANDKKGDRWPDTGDVNPTFLLNRAQESVQDIIDSVDERFFSKGQEYTVVATFDAYEFDLPSDFKQVVAAERIVADQPPIAATWCNFFDRHDLERRSSWLIGNEYPPLLYIRGNKIGVVSPTTGYTLRVWYTRRVLELAVDADVSEIPVQWHSLVALHAARLAYGAERRGFEAWEGEYQRLIQGLQEFVESRQRMESSYVRLVEGHD